MEDWQSVFNKLKYHEFIQQHHDQASSAHVSSSIETETLEGAESKLRLVTDDEVTTDPIDTKDTEKFKSVKFIFT